MKKIFLVAAGAAIIAGACLSFTACGGSATVEFKMSEDGSSYYVSGVSGTKSALTSYNVPESYGGLPVTQIADEAFWGCTSLTNITIPDGIEYIGDRAFAQCGFDSFTIPDTVTEIGFAAFGMCDRLEEITIPESVTTLGARSFYACTKLKRVYIKANIEDIPYDTFANSVVQSAGNVYYNTSLTDVYISKSVKRIYKTAFYGNFIENIYFEGSEEEWNDVYFYEWVKDSESDGSVASKVEKSDVLTSSMKVSFDNTFKNQVTV